MPRRRGPRPPKKRWRIETGDTFGTFSAIREGPRDKWSNPRWMCRCLCGRERLIRTFHLKTGQIQSCKFEPCRTIARSLIKENNRGNETSTEVL